LPIEETNIRTSKVLIFRVEEEEVAPATAILSKYMLEDGKRQS
jgi:hypothetical protein